MVVQKRSASDARLPSNPAKYLRTTQRRHPGGDLDGLGARWMQLLRETWKAGISLGGASGPVEEVITPHIKRVEEYTTTDHSPDLMHSSPPPVFSSLSNTHLLGKKSRVGPPMPINGPPNKICPAEKATTFEHVEHPSLPSKVTATPSGASVSPPLNFPPFDPKSGQEVEEKLKALQYQIHNPPKGYKTRHHIFEHQHKAKVQAQKIRDREETVKELYRLRRLSGYKSDFSTFKSHLNYRAVLELLERREALIPSPSLTDLRSRAQTTAHSRRHSLSDDASFIERALENARKTQNESVLSSSSLCNISPELQSTSRPKPPKFSSPAFDLLGIYFRGKDQEIEQRLRPKSKPLPSALPPADEVKVKELLAKKGVVSKHAREQVTDQDLFRLRPNQWLNDEIINFYGSMILARSEASKENPVINGVASGKRRPLNAHYFSTFFWSKLSGDGYEKGRLAKWTKKFDLFSKDVILIPINHHNSHWTGAAINFRRKRIESYDSMSMDRRNVFKHLRSYLDAEHKNKKKKPFDFEGWVDYISEETPQQENGFDCGVFTCQFLESLSRGEESFNFTQDNMPYLRRRMIWEIGNAQLRNE